MADSGEQEQGAGVSMVEEQTGRGRRKGTTKPRDSSRAREDLGDVDVRLAKMESHLIAEDDRFEDIENRVMELGDGLEEARGELQAAVSDALERLSSENEALKVAHAEEIFAIREENRQLKEEMERMNGEVKDELVLLKRLVAQGAGTNHALATPTGRVEVPKPSVFKGVRNAREIDNFLWALDQFFRALGVEEDSRKVDNAPLFLAESAMVWWRRRMVDMEKGTCTIKTWVEFKQELKKQFYPEHAADEARAKLRRLTQRGTIREYTWAKLEVERRGAQSLATAITIAESLTEYKKSDKPKHKDGKGKIMGIKAVARRATRKVRRREKARSHGTGKRATRVGSIKGPSMGSIQLAAVGKGKQVEVQVAKRGRLFAQLKIGQGEVLALVDTGATDNFMRLEEAEKLGIQDGFHGQGKSYTYSICDSLCIVGSSGACMVPLKRKNGGSTLSALQLAKGMRKNEPTFLVALQAENVVSAMDIPRELAATNTKPTPSLMERIVEGLQHDLQAKLLIELIGQGKTRRFWKDDQGLVRTRRGAVFVPKWGCLRKAVMQECHDTRWASHPGAQRTQALIERGGVRMARQVGREANLHGQLQPMQREGVGGNYPAQSMISLVGPRALKRPIAWLTMVPAHENARCHGLLLPHGH
ncbi:hypothetical protein GH714_031787 [Hevea brasiliensis]|uniref:Retrotransposon gag domain-containing protein n=1 Tax=Hevea brasiliensis TaxID=3981 RepID=A0A6A6LEE5_HEVBR|nr:hypothetical protein GH714_031787 [Hevea brasiliensis]